MNKIFSKIWNRRLGRVVVASEHARRGGKKSAGTSSRKITPSLLLIAGVAGLVAGPAGAALISGPIQAQNGTKTASASATGVDATAAGAGSVAQGTGGTAYGAGSTANGGANTAIGFNAISTGQGWSIGNFGNRRTDGLGFNVTPNLATGASVALGAGANSGTDAGTALGSYAQAGSMGAIALGIYSNALGRSSMAQGSAAYASGLQSTAIGSFSAATADRATTIGTNSTASGVDSNAIGTSATASGARAIALGSARTANVNTDTLQNTTDNTRAAGTDSIAIGTSSRATADNAVALGADSHASVPNSVALGAASTTTANLGAAAYNPGSTALAGTASAANGEVSVGSAGRERRVTNVAAGAAATDAVNISQLRSEAQKSNALGAATAAALGGGAVYDPATGAVSEPSYSVGGSTVRDVSAAVSNLDGRTAQNRTQTDGLTQSVNNLSNGSAGLVRQNPTTQEVTVAAQSGGSSVDFTNAGGDARVLGGVAAGTLAENSSEAVNGSQLFATNARVTGAEGKVTTINTAIGGIQGDITTINTNVSNLDGRVTTVEGSVTDLTEQLNSGEAGLVRQAGEAGAITVAGDKAGTSVDFANVEGEARVLSGLADGALGADSTEAVNGSQLLATNERVSAAEGNITTINTSIGEIRTDITTVDGRVSTVEGSVTNLTQQLNSGDTGLVRQDAETGAITVAVDKAGRSVSIANVDGEARRLSGVADGTAAGDAVNFGQLSAQSDRVNAQGAAAAAALGGGASYESASGAISAPSYTVGGESVGNVGDAIIRLNTAVQDVGSGASGLVRQAGGSDAISVGAKTGGRSVNFADVDGRARNLSGVADGVAETDAVNMRQLQQTGLVDEDGKALDAVTYDSGSNRGSVTFNEGGAVVKLGNVAAGTAETDATNMGQLKATAQSVATALGGEAAVNADGTVAAPSFTVDGVPVRTVGAAIENLDGRTSSNSQRIDEIAGGATGLVRQPGAIDAITLGAHTGGASADFTNVDGEARVLSGVADGALAADSTEAVNGSQLFATNERVSTAEGNIATINTSIGEIRTDITTVDRRVTTVEGSVTNLTEQLNSGEAGLVLQDGQAGAISVAAQRAGTLVDFTNVDGEARVLSGVADGVAATDAVNLRQLQQIGLVDEDGKTLDAVTYDSGSNRSAVTFNEGGAAVKLANVATGTENTDATNVGQLKATAQSVAAALGGGAAVNADGTIAAPSYSVGGATVNTMGAAIENLDGRTTSNSERIDEIAGGATGLVRQPGAIDAITVGAETGGTSVNFSNADGQARKLSGVADGEAAGDAVNFGQLSAQSTRASVQGASTAAALGGGAAYDADTGAISAPSFTVGGESVGNVGDAITRLNTAVQDVGSGASGLVRQVGASDAITVGASTGGTSVNLANVDGQARTLSGVADGVAETDAVNMRQLQQTGLVDEDGKTLDAVTYDSGSNRGAVTFNEGGAAVKLGNVAAGAADTDATNLGQLKASAQSAANALGGNAAVNADGTLSAPTYSVGGESVRTVGAAIDNLDRRTTSNHDDIKAIARDLESGVTGVVRQDATTHAITVGATTAGTSVDFTNVDGNARVLSGVADGSEETDAVNVRQLRSAGLVDDDGNTRDAVTYDSGSDRSAVTFNSGGAPVQLQNVAAGRANTDAANVGQMRDVVSLLGGGADVDANGNIVAPSYQVEDVSYSNVGDALKGLAVQVGSTKDRVTVVEQVQTNLTNNHLATSGDQESKAQAKGGNAVAVGASANASGSASAAMGYGAQASGDNGIAIGSNSQAVGDSSMAMGTGARAVAGNSVALGAGSVANRENTVSVGAPGSERAIANVADGVMDTDAVNKRQLDSAMGSTLNYTNQQLMQLQNDIDSVRRDANANAASAMAVANLPQAVIPGKGMASAAVSNMSGESAVAVGVSKFSEDGRWVTKLSGSVNTRGNAGVAAGIGFHW